MKKFYTWKEIENELKLHRKAWPSDWLGVDVYSDCIEIFVRPSEEGKTRMSDKDGELFKKLFGNAYKEEEAAVFLTFTGSRLKILYEDDPDMKPGLKPVSPLFKSVYLNQDANVPTPEKELAVPVIAFHSYKGGVGRTLSLLAFVRELTELYQGEKKVLVIDGDVEAPGLTWMVQEQNNGSVISYLDILSLIHNHSDRDELLEKIKRAAELSVMDVESESVSAQHFFLPTYREQEQLLNIYASPEQVLFSSENKFLLPEFFSDLGKKLGADAVLIDLRAGISEYSAPFLFDPRVKKYFVTSTSWESVMGMQLILKQVIGYNKGRDDLPQILLTMVPPKEALSEEKISEIETKLMEPVISGLGIEETGGGELDNYVVKIDFDSDLIHISGIQQVCEKLRRTDLRARMDELVRGRFAEPNEKNKFSEEKVRRVLKKIHEIAREEQTAEGSASSNMLCTEMIQRIARTYQRELPRLVVLGAKGSGKTYLYKQLLIKKTWNNFLRMVDKNTASQEETYIIPVLCTKDRTKWISLLKECIAAAREGLGIETISNAVYSDNENYVKKFKEKEHSAIGWQEFWRNILLHSVGEFGSFAELEQCLKDKNKKLLFILDGCENLFDETPLSANSKRALEILCRDIMNELNELEGENIGMVTFLRRDLAEEAITTNYKQFETQYSSYELNWSQTEALRLALWIAAQADESFLENTTITKATKEMIEQRLQGLWGMKLGKDDSKEAYSSRWIIAALSDFNGQLQARDIVRFLANATSSSASVNLLYKDRYLMPAEVRRAIGPCSDEKVLEIKQEIHALAEAFEKLEKVNEEDKQLPLKMERLPLTAGEINALIKQGFLRLYKEQYYMPEIIRLHLGFRYQAGARPKVLSLLLK